MFVIVFLFVTIGRIHVVDKSVTKTVCDFFSTELVMQLTNQCLTLIIYILHTIKTI